jgi:hypothetical protein
MAIRRKSPEKLTTPDLAFTAMALSGGPELRNSLGKMLRLRFAGVNHSISKWNPHLSRDFAALLPTS